MLYPPSVVQAITRQRESWNKVIGSLEEGTVAALPQFIEATCAWRAARDPRGYAMFLGDGTGWRPLWWFVEGFLDANGDAPWPPRLEVRSSAGRTPKPTRPEVPIVPPETLAADLLAAPGWASACQTGLPFLVITNTLATGGTAVRLVEAVRLASAVGRPVSIDFLVAHIEEVVPRHGTVTPSGKKQNLARELGRLGQMLNTGPGGALFPPSTIVEWADPSEHPALLASRPANLGDPKIPEHTQGTLRAAGITRETQEWLLPHAATAMRAAGEACGHNWRRLTGDHLRTATANAAKRTLRLSTHEPPAAAGVRGHLPPLVNPPLNAGRGIS